MAKKVARKAATGACQHHCSPGLMAVKGIILLLFGLVLWGGYLSLDVTIAILLVLAGIKFLLAPLWMGK